MTLLIGVRRPDFAVIGADRRGTGVRWEEEHRTAFSFDHPKIAVQDKLAYGSGGLGKLGSQTTLDVIAEGLSEAPGSGLAPMMAAAFLSGKLSLLVTQERNSWPADVQSDSAKVTVLLAGMAGDRAHLMIVTADAPAPKRIPWPLRLVIRVNTPLPSSQFGEVQRFYATCPDSVRPFVGPLLSSKFEQPTDTESSESIAGQVRDLILEAIDQERQVLGENRHLGGGADVAIVDRDGARLLDPSTA